MKILFINSEAELFNNGSDKMLLLSVRALKDRHDVRVLLPEPGPLAQALREQGIACDVMPYPILRRGHLNPWSLPGFVGRLAASTWRLARRVRRERVDMVYSNTLSVLPGALLHLLGRCAHVWHIHDYVDEPSIAHRLLSGLASVAADRVICVSAAVDAHLGTRSGNSRVVWNGIPPLVASPVFERPSRAVTVTVVGRFNRLKGQRHLVEAARILEDDAVTAGRFVVRLVGGTYKGDDRHRQAVARRVCELGLADVVRIDDSVEDVAPVYLESDLVVVPSDRPDPFPTVALESMSVGTPVIAHAVGGLPEMLDFDADCLARRGDAADLAAKVRRMIVDPSFRLAKARQQHERYPRHFRFESYAARLCAEIDALAPAPSDAHCPL